jgi:hypothetical protein
VFMIPLNILYPNMTSLYSMSWMTMVALALRPCCNILFASYNKLLLFYKLVQNSFAEYQDDGYIDVSYFSYADN